jgi:site-specific DNA-adenine methylase
MIANNGTPETILNLQSGDITINEAYKYTQREQTNSKRNRSAELGEIITLPQNIDLRYGDFKTVLADIPDNSLDLILTDPPYPKEFLTL